MNAQDTPTTAPAWFNLDGLFTPEQVAQYNGLADEVEQLKADFEERLAERCFRALVAFDRVTSNDSLGVEAFELVRSLSGAGRLYDALYALADTVNAANSERPNSEPAWWVKVRAELGLDEWGVTAP